MVVNILLLGLLFFLSIPVEAANFSPAILKLSAPPVVQYDFDGTQFSLPVTVSGTPSNVIFLVFTKDRAASVRKVQNGYLGWHYMNNIDTCLYTSEPYQFEPGTRKVVWDGKDKDGKMVPPGAYTYYLWGIDNISPRTKMASVITLGWESRDYVQTHAGDGSPLAQPVVWTASYLGENSTAKVDYTRKKWIIGNDPDNAALIETCSYKTWAENSSLALDPQDNTMFFTECMNNAGKLVVWKMKWVPNGSAILQTDWGEKDGQTSWNSTLSPGWAYMGGPVSDGANLLFFPNGDMSDNGTESNIVFMDTSSGKIIRKLDTSNWWIDPNGKAAGAQNNGGPTDLVFLKGRLHASSHSSCIDQCIDPYNEDDMDATLWVNQNGDYTGDHNFEGGSGKAWVCNDYNVGPYKYQATMDENLFTSFSAYDVGAVTFGLYAPDGSGMGYIALSGETSGFKAGQYVVDSGSNYDGYYSDYSSAPDASQQSGWWFSAHDSIKGTIISTGNYLWVSSPNGGEIWGSGTLHQIDWISSGVSAVRIEYSTDNGISWNLIADNVSAAAYSWKPEGIQSDKCLIRVTSVSDPSLNAVSRAPFTITPPYVKLTAPNGGEVLETGASNAVSWTFLGIETVNIEYSPDNGSTWTNIASGVSASQKSYSWKVPVSITDRCLVRVSDAANASISDVSDAVFQIKASFIQVTMPNGGEEWEARQTQTIAWSASSSISTVRIEFSADNGSSWSTVAEKVAASGGSYSWKIPNLASPRCLIRVSDMGSTGVSDINDGTFTIIPSTSQWVSYSSADGLGGNSIWTVVSDFRGGVWVGTGETWSGSGGISYFNGTTWTTYTTRNSGIAADNVYALAVDNDGVVWVGTTWNGLSRFDGKNWTNYSTTNSTLPDNDIRDLIVDHNNVLWITAWHGGVTSITGNIWKSYGAVPHGEILAVDLDNTLWVGYNFGDGGVSHFDGTTWKRYYQRDGLAGNYVLGIAIDQDGKKWFATSGGITTFDGATWNTFTNLKGSFIQAVAIDHDGVKWFGYSGGVVSYDGREWKTYTTGNSELCSNNVWRIAVDTRNVKWFATRDNGISSFASSLGPYVRTASPNGGELWESGSTHEITWVSKDVERITIEYSLDNGSTWNVISGNVDASLKSYSWKLPQMKSSSCKVRLTDVSDASHTDLSNGVFTISPPFVQVISPNGGERWASGSSHAITWISVGVNRVKLEYSVDGGNSWQFINSVDAVPGTYPWTVPQVESADCRIRITDADTIERTDTGDSPFIIMRPYITVTAPNGGESWTAGQAQTITWESDGVERVTVEYSVDGGLSWNPVSKNIDASVHSCTWWPVGVDTRLGLVRVTDSENMGITDVSDAVFSTRQIISVTDRVPEEFSVSPNSPNPFNPSTVISFSLPKAERVKMDIYNLSGQKVESILGSRMEAGRHAVTWNAKGLSAGVYLALVRAGAEVKTIKMLYMK